MPFATYYFGEGDILGCGTLVFVGDGFEQHGRAADYDIYEHHVAQLAPAYAAYEHHAHRYAHQQQGVGEALVEQQRRADKYEYGRGDDAGIGHIMLAVGSLDLRAAQYPCDTQCHRQLEKLGGEDQHACDAHGAAHAVDIDAAHKYPYHEQQRYQYEEWNGIVDACEVHALD